MKKVIFLGGTEFSGSTLFNMILGNDKQGFAAGEIRALFYSHRAKRQNLADNCGCEDPNCGLWYRILLEGEENVYDTIFRLFPDIEFIVDASKNPFWIQSKSRNLQKKGIRTKNILLWKTPLEYAHSRQKRGKLRNWDQNWINYHRLYFSLIGNWRAIQYQKLVKDERNLIEACRYLGIPYFQDKEAFWEKKHHILGGNYSTKVHLTSIDSAKKYSDSFDEERLKFHRQIYYRDVEDEGLQLKVEQSVAHSSYLQQVPRLLEEKDVASGKEETSCVLLQNLKFNRPELRLRQLYRMTKDRIAKYQYAYA